MREFVLFAITMVLAPATLQSQRPVDVSGEWVAVGSSPQKMRIEQSASTLTVQYGIGDRWVRTTRWAFGEPTIIEAGSALYTPASTTASLHDSGVTFVGTVTLADGSSGHVSETWSLEPSGNTLTIVRVITSGIGTTASQTRTFQRVP